LKPSLSAARPPLRLSRAQGGPAISLLLFLLLGAPVMAELWRAWQSEASLSHGPVVFLLSAYMLWARREALSESKGPSRAGFVFFLTAAFLYVAAFFVDAVFLKSLSLFGIALGALWYLGGASLFRAAAGPVGFLAFTIPWPTVLVERLAFPLQLISSAYAAMIGGLIGLPVHREGVHLSVMSASGDKPIYSVLVAQQCSGLTSLTVLLALSYLIAYYTPVRFRWRLLMVGLIPLLTLLANAVRLTLILLVGARYNAALAQWVHDHEAPVLIFFCSLGLMGVRQMLLAWDRPDRDPEGGRKAEGDRPSRRLPDALAPDFLASEGDWIETAPLPSS
jgi:exosortase